MRKPKLDCMADVEASIALFLKCPHFTPTASTDEEITQFGVIFGEALATTPSTSVIAGVASYAAYGVMRYLQDQRRARADARESVVTA